MSLREFHIFFITASIILSFGVAAWSVFNPVGQQHSALGVFSGILGAALVYYGMRVFRKLKRLEEGR